MKSIKAWYQAGRSTLCTWHVIIRTCLAQIEGQEAKTAIGADSFPYWTQI